MRALLLYAALAAGCSDVDTVDGSGGSPPVGVDRWETVNGTILELPPGSDQDLCQNFANPFGEDVDLDELVVRSAGAKSVELYLVDGAHDSGIGSCLLVPGTQIYSGDGKASVHIDATLPEGTGLMIRARFVNDGADAGDGFVIARLHAR